MAAVHGQRGMLGIQWQLCQSEVFNLSTLCLSVKRKHYVELIHCKPLVHHISRSQQLLQGMAERLCNACPCDVCSARLVR